LTFIKRRTIPRSYMEVSPYSIRRKKEGRIHRILPRKLIERISLGDDDADVNLAIIMARRAFNRYRGETRFGKFDIRLYTEREGSDRKLVLVIKHRWTVEDFEREYGFLRSSKFNRTRRG